MTLVAYHENAGSLPNWWRWSRSAPAPQPVAELVSAEFDALTDEDFDTPTPVDLARANIAREVSYHEAEIAAQLAAKVARAETLQEATARVRAKDAEADELIRQHKEALALYQPKALLSDTLQKPKAKGRG